MIDGGLPRRRPSGSAVALIAALVSVHVLRAVATVVGSVLLIEGMLALAPGDAIDLVPNGEELRGALEQEWGLGGSLPARMGATVQRLASADLGTSLTWRPGAPVSELVVDTGLRSLALLAPALALSLVLAVLLGIWSSDGNRPLLRVVQVVSVVPAFLGAYLLVAAINASTWALMAQGWIDRPPWFALPDTPGAARSALAIVVLAVASGGLTEMHAAADVELRRLRAAPFVQAARARGASIWPVILHNLLPALADIAASRTAWLIGSLVVVEKLLLLSGAGAALWQACRMRDYPVAIGITLASATVVAGARLCAELGRLALDPRLRGSP